MNKNKSKAKKVLGIIGMVVGGIALMLLLSFAVMWIWNALMPKLFGLTVITYWQGVGLAVLGRLLLGGFGGGHSGDKGHKCGPVRDEIRNEIRKEFRKEYRKEMDEHKCGDWGEAWSDDVYEDWWEKEGRAGFEAYTKREKEEE